MDKFATIDVSHYPTSDTVHVEQLFPFAKPNLQRYLAEAITRRRRVLLYWKHRHQALERHSAPKDVKEDVKSTDGVAETPSQVKNTNDDQAAYIDLEKNPEDQHTVRFTGKYPLSSTATTSAPPTPPKSEILDDQGSIAMTESSDMSIMGDYEIPIPPCPENLGRGCAATFECPLCFSTLEISTDRQWRYGDVLVHFSGSS